MTNEARKLGYQAEDRIIKLAANLGFSARKGSQIEDYGGGKTDVVIYRKDGSELKIQVSCYGKRGKRARTSLLSKNIYNIAAGPQISDEQLIEIITNLTKT